MRGQRYMQLSEQDKQRLFDRANVDWVQGIRQNDKAVTDDLWHLLYLYAYNLVRYERGDVDEAFNTAHTAFSRITTRGINQYNMSGKFTAYCKQALIYAYLDRMRRQTRVDRVMAPAELEDELLGDEGLTQTTLESSQIWKIVKPCHDALPEREQTIIVWIHFNDAAPSQIAEHLSISRTYVNTLAHRARTKLRKCLEKRGFEFSADFL